MTPHPFGLKPPSKLSGPDHWLKMGFIRDSKEKFWKSYIDYIYIYMCFESLAITFRRSSLVSTVEAKAWKFSVAADASTEGSGRSGFRSWQTVCHVAVWCIEFWNLKNKKTLQKSLLVCTFRLIFFFQLLIPILFLFFMRVTFGFNHIIISPLFFFLNFSFVASWSISLIPNQCPLLSDYYFWVTDDSLVCWGLDFYWLWLSISMIMLSRLCHEKRDWSKRMAFAYRMLYMQHMAAVNCPPDLANLNYYVLQLLHLCMTWPVTQTLCPYMFLNHII